MRRVLMVLVLVLGCVWIPVAIAAPNPIAAENAHAGTPSWKYPEAPQGSTTTQYAGDVLSITGYPSQESVLPGGQLQLHVSSADGESYRVEVYRLGWYGGIGARLMACSPCSGGHPGTQQPAPPAPDANGEVLANWPVTDTIPVGTDWVSGYYIAQLVLTTGPNAGTSRWVPFVVRDPASNRARIVVQVPTNTWQAYNGWGGRSLYDKFSSGNVQANRVSFQRPLWDAEWTLFDYEFQTVRFLERNGYDVTYATDADVDGAPQMLRNHAVVIANGHDEYWSRAQRDGFDAARDSGVNLAFIGANIGYWQVRYADDHQTLIGYKRYPDPIADPAARTTTFRELGRPECQLLGVQYKDDAPVSFAPSDSVVRNLIVAPSATQHPWFDGTGLSVGNELTDTLGYEWDLITPGCQHPPLTRLFTWSDPAGTLPHADAVMYTAPSGAKVFAAGSLYFVRAIDGWRGYDWNGLTQRQPNPKVERFMANMLDDMTRNAVPAQLPPTAVFTASPLTPTVGRPVILTDTSTAVAPATISIRSWDLNGDGVFGDAAGPTATVTFTTPGAHRVGLQVTDTNGLSATTDLTVTVSPAGSGQSTTGRPNSLKLLRDLRVPPGLRGTALRRSAAPNCRIVRAKIRYRPALVKAACRLTGTRRLVGHPVTKVVAVPG